MPSKLHFKEIDFVIYFPATGNENRDFKKYGVAYRDRVNGRTQSGFKINFEDVLTIPNIQNNYPHTVGHFIEKSGRGKTYRPDYIEVKSVSDENELLLWIKEIGL